MIEPLLLTTTKISTFDGNRLLTGATGFFFERDKRRVRLALFSSCERSQ